MPVLSGKRLSLVFVEKAEEAHDNSLFLDMAQGVISKNSQVFFCYFSFSSKRKVDIPLLRWYWRGLGVFGAPGRTRTCNLLIRSQVLYPVELRARCFVLGRLGEEVFLYRFFYGFFFRFRFFHIYYFGFVFFNHGYCAFEYCAIFYM